MVTSPLKPTRALLHPLWWAALIVLATNDHLLKGAGLLPGEITGKLSDFAGLLVAPVLFAALLGARRRGALLAAHLAVGAVFAALQLSAEVSAAWSGLFAALGVGWQTWRDPTDLMALPMLLVSWRVLVPAMARMSGPRERHATARFAAASLGLVFCMGTSPPPEERSPQNWTPRHFTDVYLHNSTGEDFVVRLRKLRAGIGIDCDAVAEDPGAMLSGALFGEGDTWTMPADATLPVWRDDDFTRDRRTCYAVRMESDLMEPWVFFWRGSDIPMRDVPGSGTGSGPGGVSIVSANTVTLQNLEGQVAFELAELPAELAPGCEAQPDAERLAWSEPMPIGNFELVGVEPGVDGCLAVELRGSAASTARRWYVCMPLDAWPYGPGDALQIFATADSGAEGLVYGDYSGVRFERITAGEPDDYDAISMSLSVGSGLPAVAGATGSLSAIESCGATADACGSVSTAARLSLRTGSELETTLQAGQSELIERVDGTELEVFLVHAATRPVVETSCSEGPGSTGADLEAVIIERFPRTTNP